MSIAQFWASRALFAVVVSAAGCGPHMRTVLGSEPPAPPPNAPAASNAPASQSPAPGAATPWTAAPGVAEPPPLSITPFFPGPANDALQAGDYLEAKSQFELLRGATQVPARATRLAILVAHCASALGDEQAAAMGFAEAADNTPLLHDYLRYRAAVAYQAAGDFTNARLQAERVAKGARQYDNAVLLIGGMLHAQGQWEASAAHHAAYLKSGKARVLETRMRLAEALENSGKGFPEAHQVYRYVAVHGPLTQWAKTARSKQITLTRRFPKKKRAAINQLTGPENLTQGLAYFRAHRNPLAARAFKQALSTNDLDPDQTCIAAFHRAESWWKQRNRTRSAPLFDTASDLCAKTKNVDLQVKSAYQAGRSLDRLEKEQESISRFERVEREHPTHSYADDARLRISEAHEEMGQLDQADAVLASIPAAYPKGDIFGLALWRLAFRAFKRGDYARTITLLEQRVSLIPIEKNWKFEGQAEYWLGRAHAQLGKNAEAMSYYERTARTYPLTYYALLALNRLREADTTRFDALLAELQEPSRTVPPPLAAAAVPLAGDPDFERGIELLRLGLGTDAARELAKAGLAAPRGKREVTDPRKQEKLWLMAYLFDAAGRYPKSHWPTRWHILDYRRHWPAGAWKERWRIAYPRAYWDLLDRYAKERGHPTELQIAFVREESAFNPNLESWANAIGLTQMIFPTARQYGRGTGIRISRANLRDPEKNVIIGSLFLKSLLERFGGQVAVAVPAYNAGPARMKKWWSEMGDVPQDVFAESIFGDQPRGYAKRVIGSYFAYSYLESGAVPDIPLTLTK